MKLKNLIFAGATSLLLFSACSNDNGDKIRTLADYDNVTTADSLLYYFGQLRAVDYWHYAYNDTTLKTRQSRDEYLKGLRAGLDAAQENDAYNQGLSVGVQLAMNMQEFSDEYGVKLNRQIVFNAIQDGLKNDSAVNGGEANQMFRRVLEELNIQKEKNDRENAIATLEEAAKAGKWQKIGESLYAGPVKVQGNGPAVKSGDFVGVNIEINNTDGKEIDRRNQDRAKVGQSFPGPVTEALLTMKIGESRVFYTTGPAMFGRFIGRYNVKPTQLLTFTLTVSEPSAPKTEENAE